MGRPDLLAKLRPWGSRMGWYRCHVLSCDHQFAERSPTGPTKMPARLNGPTVSLVDATAVLAPPGISGQSGHFFAQRVIDRDTETISIHPGHHATKISAMIRATLQDIVLPLVNHFVRQGHDGFVVLLQVVRLKEHGRQPDASSSGRLLGGARKRLPRSDPADKHSGGASQPTAPLDGNRG